MLKPSTITASKDASKQHDRTRGGTPLLILVRFIFLVLALSIASVKSETNATVAFVTAPWTSTFLNVAIARQIIEDRIPHVKVIVEEGVGSREIVVDLSSTQDPKVALEVWGNEDIVDNLFQLGNLQHIGELGVVGQVAWFVPNYMVKKYPQCVNWEFYKDDTNAQIFSTPETAPKARLLSGPPEWGIVDGYIISNLDLAVEQVFTANESALVSAIGNAVETEDPVLAYYWTPSAVVSYYNLAKVRLPAFDNDCEFYIARSYERYDCEYQKDQLDKFASKAVAEQMPDVFEFVSKFSLTNEDQSSMLARVEFGGESVEDVARAWIEENRARWETWLPGYALNGTMDQDDDDDENDVALIVGICVGGVAVIAAIAVGMLMASKSKEGAGKNQSPVQQKETTGDSNKD